MISTKTSEILASLITLASALMLLPAHAAFVVDGNYVLARTELKAAQCPTFCSPTLAQAGATSASIPEQSLSAPQRETRAEASVVADGILQFKVSASSSAPGATSFSTPTAQASAEAIYRDVILPTAPGAPSQLSLQFTVHGEFQVSDTTDPGVGISNISQGFLQFGAKDDVISFTAPFLSDTNANVQNNDGGVTEALFESTPTTSWLSAGFTELGTNHYAFDGTVARLVDLNVWPFPLPDAPNGAYFVNVGLGAFTFSRGSTTVVDASNTATLVGITLADGSPLPADFAFTLESGASYSAVPIPAPPALIAAPLLLMLRAHRRTAR